MGTRFERFHPLVVFLYYAGTITFFLLLQQPIFLAAGFLVALIINFLHDRFKGLRRWLYWLMTSVFFIVFLNPLFNERGQHLLFVIGTHRFTLEAFVFGGMTAVSLVSVMALFVSYNLVMTPNKLLFLFSRFLPQLAVLLMLTLRFIPLMRRRMDEITLIQRSKGFSTNQGYWRSRVKTALAYVQTLVTFSLEEAIQTADSMKARGYGTGPRTTYEYFRINKNDMIALLSLIVLSVPILIGRFLGFGYLTVYPIMESWLFSIKDVQIFICFLLYTSFPILVEAGGVFRWRILK